MEQLWLKLRSIEFTSPLLFFVVFSTFLVVFVATKIWRGKRGHIELADIDNIKFIGTNIYKFNKVLNSIFLIAFMFLASVLVAAPYSVSEKTIERATTEYKSLVILLTDISSSMRNRQDRLGEDERSIFEVVRDAQINYLEQVRDVRVGVVMYSNDALPYRFPTSRTQDLIELFKTFDIGRVTKNEIGERQLGLLSAGTNTSAGLKASGAMITSALRASNFEEKEAAIILFTDLADDSGPIIENIKQLTARNIKVYIVAGGKASNSSTNNKPIPESFPAKARVEAYKELALTDSKVELFHVRSTQELNKAFSDLANLDKIPILIREKVVSENSLTGVVALITLVTLLFWFFVVEFFTRTTRERR